MIINGEEFISDKECSLRYENADIRKETHKAYIYYSGFAYYHRPAIVRPKGRDDFSMAITGKKVYLKGMIGTSDDMPPFGTTTYDDLFTDFHNRKLIKSSRFLLINGDITSKEDILELENPIIIDSETCFYYRVRELDELANQFRIAITPKPHHTLNTSASDTSPASLSIQEKREIFLKGWLTGHGQDINDPLEFTKKDLWDLLSKADIRLFPPAAPDTIKGFFKSQSICSFKTGRRKGGT